MAWQTIRGGTLSDRNFEIQKNSDGDFRIRTTNSVESAPSVHVSDDSVLIGVPGIPGETVDIDVEDEDQVRDDLTSVGISEADQDAVIDDVRDLGGLP